MSRISRTVARKLVSSVVPRDEPSRRDEPRFVGTPSRQLVMPDRDETTVVEPEEWIRARDQIALVVRSTIAEAILPLQEALAALAEQNASLARRIDALSGARPTSVGDVAPRPPPSMPGATMLPPPPASTSSMTTPPPSTIPAPPPSDSCLAKVGGLAKKLREEKGFDVSALELASTLLERIAARVDERAAEELASDLLQQREA